MTRNFCRDCICLVEGDNGEWVCDECQKTVEEVTECPETDDETETSRYRVRVAKTYYDYVEVEAIDEEEAIDIVASDYDDRDMDVSIDFSIC